MLLQRCPQLQWLLPTDQLHLQQDYTGLISRYEATGNLRNKGLKAKKNKILEQRPCLYSACGRMYSRMYCDLLCLSDKSVKAELNFHIMDKKDYYC